MTAVQDAPAPALEIGRDRRRKEDQRLITGRTRWTDNLTLPGMLHLAMVRSPHAHANIKSIDTAAANAMTNVVDVFTGKDFGESPGREHQRLADHHRPGHARPLADGRRPGRVRRRDRRRGRGPHAPPRLETPPSWSTWSTRSCPPRSTSRRPRRTTVLAHPDSRHQQVRVLAARLRRAGTGGDDRGGHRGGPHRRHRDRAGVPPAAADPGVHGAALDRGRPDRRADTRCGRPPRSRTSPGSCWPRPPACPSRRSG